jgi:gamma-glutamylputrescine oxidase
MTTPYWLEEPSEPLRRHRLEGPPEVVVVGGGITGFSCALTLARAGKRVRLYEARSIAEGASGRNGGFALRGGAAAYPEAMEWLGVDPAREFWAWTERYLDRIEELGGDAFRRTGSIRLANDAAERDELRAEVDALRSDGFEAEWVDEPGGPLAGRFPAGILHPPDGVLQPARLVRRVAAAAADAGVEIREHERLESLEGLDAEAVVVATDGYPSGLLGALEGLIVPTRAQMLATEPLAEVLFERPHYGRHGFDYWHQRRDGTLLAGGFRDVSLESEFTAEETVTEPIQQALQRFVSELLGFQPEIRNRWAGIFGLVTDLMPVVGRVPGEERLWVAGGYSGHGMVLGFACGDLVAEAVLGRDAPLLELFAPERLVLL